jgi:TrmH family RNA methyltransferase
LRRLVHNRATRWADRAFVAEGLELLRSALDAGVAVEAVYVAAEGAGDPAVDALADRALAAGLRVFALERGVLAKVADTVTPQPVLTVLAMLDRPRTELAGATLVVVCADVRDPGNLGTVLRSADAAGVDAVVCAGGTVDPYNPKTVRSSAGSVFHVPLVVDDDTAGLLDQLGRDGLARLGTDVRAGTDYVTVDWRAPTALVLGNESAGLDPGLAARLDGSVHIPMAGRAESLNVGVAAAVLCFEALRQRRSVPDGPVPGSTIPGMPARDDVR